MKKFLAFLGCFVILACGNSNENANINTSEPGDNAPGFNLKTVDNEMVSLEDYPDAKGLLWYLQPVPARMQ